jgi:uncharacterized SAM-binding protein YcdF (DUF218 family)
VTGLEKPVRATLARPVRKRRGRWLLPVALLSSLLILILLAFRQQVLDGMGQFLVVSDPLERADLIYVFAGDFWGSRVLSGANLGSQGWAPKVVMSGGLYSGGGEVNRYAGDLAVEFAVRHGYSRGLFLSVPMEAQSTIDEARYMGPIFHRLGARRVILVTSNFHSRRAAEVFRLFLPEFDFRMEGAPDDTFDPHAWWKTPQQRHLLFGEFQKMLGTLLVRFHVASAGWLRQGSEPGAGQ